MSSSEAIDVDLELEEDEDIEVAPAVVKAVQKKPRPPFGDCMFGRHEKCKKVLESGEECNCDCGDKHGTEFVQVSTDTPLHRLFLKIAAAHKAGKSYSESDEFKDLVVESKKEVAAAAVEEVLKPKQSRVVVNHLVDPEENETIEELEQKRA